MSIERYAAVVHPFAKYRYIQYSQPNKIYGGIYVFHQKFVKKWLSECSNAFHFGSVGLIGNNKCVLLRIYIAT